MLIVLGLIAVAASTFLCAQVLKVFGVNLDEKTFWPPLFMVPSMLLGYYIFVRFAERRPVDELTLAGAPQEFACGYLLGAGLFTAVTGILASMGVYAVVGMHPPMVMLAPFFWMIIHATLEELIFRGVMFRFLERSLGSVVALVLSSAIFGAVHLFNPGATLVSGLAISVEAGILLGVTFMVTRRLWLCIGLHAAWNFVQGSVFSVPVSGFDSVGLFAGRLEGPDWLTEGKFGVEGSVVAVVLSLCLATFLFYRAKQIGHVRKPFWRAAHVRCHAPALTH